MKIKKYAKPKVPTLYFLHIPKTAGTSVAQFLRSNYDEAHSLGPQTWNMLYDYQQSNDQLGSVENILQNKHLVIGHYGSCMKHYLLNPVTITILREPVKRTISQLIHIKERPPLNNWVRPLFIYPHESIGDIINDDRRLEFFRDYQLKYLSSDFDYMKIVRKSGFNGEDLLFDSSKSFQSVVSDEKLLSRSRTTLDKMLFVGIQDYMEESLILLAYKIGWKPPDQVPSLNKKSSNKEPLTKKETERIREIVKNDTEIYLEYKRKFEEEFLLTVNRLTDRTIKDWPSYIKSRRSILNTLRERIMVAQHE